ncbi:MAG: hypothetical protein Q8N15_00760 [Bacillota bacterium]|nr:hypothetical protein [Bacillota bacterium]
MIYMVWYWVPIVIMFVELFIVGFLSSRIMIAGKQPKTNRRFQNALIAGMYLSAAASVVINLAYYQEPQILYYPYGQWVRLLFPCMIICFDVLAQKLGMEAAASDTPMFVRRHAIGLGAHLICFYGAVFIGCLGNRYFFESLWVFIIIIPLGATMAAISAMNDAEKRHRVGRLVTAEVIASTVIAIDTIMMIFIFTIGSQ